MIARPVAVGLAVAALFLAGCRKAPEETKATSGTAGRPKLHFIHDWFPEPEHGGYFAASILGYWNDEGLDVDVIPGGPNAEIEKRVALDSVGLGIVRADSVFIAADRGLPIIAVNSYFQHDPQGIMVRADSKIHGFADLEDKDVAMQVGNTWFPYLQRKYGLQKTRVRAVTGSVANFVKDPEWITQAYPTSEPYYAAKEGVPARVLQISDSGFDPYRVIIANRELVEKHADWVAGFTRGALRGWKEYFRNPSPIHEHIGKISPTMEADGMKFSYVKMRALHLVEGVASKGESMGAVDPRRWEELSKILLDLGLIKSAPVLTNIYTDAFAPARLGIDPALPPAVWTEAELNSSRK
jgi:NitT/TauT family transport system substrate-binding protein